MMNQKEDILKDFIDEINFTQEKVNKISVIRNGQNISKYVWNKKKNQNMHSVAKTFVSLAVGFAINDKLLSLEHPVAQLFPEYVKIQNKEALTKLELHHLLSMSIGQNQPYLMMEQRNSVSNEDWIDYSLNQPFDFKPGEKFIYSNVGPYLAGVAVERKTGMRLIQYLQSKLLDPLAIQIKDWEKDKLGNTFGAGGIYLTHEDFTKVILLLLNNGVYKNKRILPAEWVNIASKPHIIVGENDKFSTHYGYGLWIDEETKSYRADGAFGQLGIIFYEKNAAVVVNSEKADNQVLVEMIYRLIYSKL